MSSYSLPLLIASDHAGLTLKNDLKKHRIDINWKDLGCFNSERTDYTDWADKLCSALQGNMLGVLVCGTGQGMCIKANRHLHIRAVLCWNEEIAKLSKAHNKANVLCLSGRFLSSAQALKILDVFLKTDFDNQKAYQKRVEKLSLRV